MWFLVSIGYSPQGQVKDSLGKKSKTIFIYRSIIYDSFSRSCLQSIGMPEKIELGAIFCICRLGW